MELRPGLPVGVLPASYSEKKGGVILEVCGFNRWLIKLLAAYGCRQVILIQPEKRSKRKTDRRDASALAELLWVNRIKHLLRKYNLGACPTKGLDTLPGCGAYSSLALACRISGFPGPGAWPTTGG